MRRHPGAWRQALWPPVQCVPGLLRLGWAKPPRLGLVSQWRRQLPKRLWRTMPCTDLDVGLVGPFDERERE